MKRDGYGEEISDGEFGNVLCFAFFYTAFCCEDDKLAA